MTAAMAAQRPWPIAVVWLTVRSYQLPGSSHRRWGSMRTKIKDIKILRTVTGGNNVNEA